MRATDFTRAQRVLLAKKALFPKQTQDDLATGKIRFIDADINHCAEISEAGGIYDLLRTTNDKQVGISDFDSNKLEAGQNVAIDRIKIAYGKAATADGKTAAEIAYSSKNSAFPTALLRAKLIIKQDNKVQGTWPVERFTHAADSPKVQGEEDALIVGTPIVLTENKPVQVQLEFNPEAGMVAGLDDHFIQVRLMGSQTSSK